MLHPFKIPLQRYSILKKEQAAMRALCSEIVTFNHRNRYRVRETSVFDNYFLSEQCETAITDKRLVHFLTDRTVSL